jgi:hypothetical protein
VREAVRVQSFFATHGTMQLGAGLRRQGRRVFSKRSSGVLAPTLASRGIHGVATTIVEPRPPSLTNAHIKEEAAKMGVLDREAPLFPREVAKSLGENKAVLRRYKQRLSAMRKAYAAEWAQRREREAQLRAEIKEAWRAARQDRKATGMEARRARIETHERRHENARRARGVRLEMSRRRQALWLLQVERRRQAWLNRLEEDSHSWVMEHEIDEKISPALFDETRVPWQYQPWFDTLSRSRAKDEAAIRAAAGGSAVQGEDIDHEHVSDWEADIDGWESGGDASSLVPAKPHIELEDDITPAELFHGMDRRDIRRMRAVKLREYAQTHLLEPGEGVLAPDSFYSVPEELASEAGENLLGARLYGPPGTTAKPVMRGQQIVDYETEDEDTHATGDVFVANSVGADAPRDLSLLEAMDLVEEGGDVVSQAVSLMTRASPVLFDEFDVDTPLPENEALDRLDALFLASPLADEFRRRMERGAREFSSHVSTSVEGTEEHVGYHIDAASYRALRMQVHETLLPKLRQHIDEARAKLQVRATERMAAEVMRSRPELVASLESFAKTTGATAAAEESGAHGNVTSGEVSLVPRDSALLQLFQGTTERDVQQIDEILDAHANRPTAETVEQGADLGPGSRADSRSLFRVLAAPLDPGERVLAGTVDIEAGLPWEADGTLDPSVADELIATLGAAADGGRTLSETEKEELMRPLIDAQRKEAVRYYTRRGLFEDVDSDALSSAERDRLREERGIHSKAAVSQRLSNARLEEARLRDTAPWSLSPSGYVSGKDGTLEPAGGVLPLLVDDGLDYAEETAIYEAAASGRMSMLRRLLERRRVRLEREAPEILERYDLDAPYRFLLDQSPAQQLGLREKKEIVEDDAAVVREDDLVPDSLDEELPTEETTDRR